MEAKQHTSEWPTNHRRNKKGNQNMHRNKWKWKHNNPKPTGFGKSSAKGKVHSNTTLPQEKEQHQINSLTLHLKQLGKEEMKNPRVSRREEIIKIRAEINDKETKETIAKINKLKAGSLRR